MIQLPIPFASSCDSTLPRYIWTLDRRAEVDRVLDRRHVGLGQVLDLGDD